MPSKPLRILLPPQLSPPLSHLHYMHSTQTGFLSISLTRKRHTSCSLHLEHQLLLIIQVSSYLLFYGGGFFQPLRQEQFPLQYAPLYTPYVILISSRTPSQWLSFWLYHRLTEDCWGILWRKGKRKVRLKVHIFCLLQCI